MFASPVFQSLLSVAEHTARQTSGIRDPVVLREKAYQYLVYFPYTQEQALDLQQQAISRVSYDGYGISLLQLQLAFQDKLHIFLQVEEDSQNFTSPSQAHFSRHPGLLRDPWHIRLKNDGNYRQLSGDNGIEALLFFKVLPEYTTLLLPALAKACTDPAAFGFASAKTMDRISHDARTQTGLIYLSQNDPLAAATMAELTHRYLIEEIAGQRKLSPEAVDLRSVYGPTVGTQFVRPGVGYIETHARAALVSSSGESVSKVIAGAIEDSRQGKPLDLALAERLDQSGKASNPAFMKRTADAELPIEDFITVLQSRTPPTFGESDFRHVTLPTRSESRNARHRFEHQNLASSQGSA